MPGARRSASILVAALLATVLLIVLSACSSKPPVVPSADAASVDVAATVVVKDMKFTPASVTIKAGQAVTWEFDDGFVKHDVVADDGSFVSELMTGGSYTHVFDTAGSYDYTCSPHPRMTGVVIVE